MHVLVDLEASWSPGKLWLGGEFASGDVKLLMDNNITTVLPASRKPSPAESLNIRVLPYVDGTALASGSVPLAEFLEVADSLINEMLQKGEGVLICCKNGAHRSATLACVMLMRMTGWRADACDAYITGLRNLVDLRSLPPLSHHRRSQTRPIDFCKSYEDQILRGHFSLNVNTVVTPQKLRSQARELGFSNLAPANLVATRAKSRARTPGTGTLSDVGSFQVVSGNETLNTVSSHEMSSLSSSETSTASKRARFNTSGVADKFLVLKDDLASADVRAQKLADIFSELSELDAKLLGQCVRSPLQATEAEKGQVAEAAPGPSVEVKAEAETKDSEMEPDSSSKQSKQPEGLFFGGQISFCVKKINHAKLPNKWIHHVI